MKRRKETGLTPAARTNRLRYSKTTKAKAWYSAWKKKWRTANPDKQAATAARAGKVQRQRPIIRIRNNLRKRLREIIGQATSKSALVGCSAGELRAHLERLFLPGMTWLNYGFGADKWHVDHIRPLAAFDLNAPAQRAAACHYTNLQPLWQIDNLRKGAKCLTSPTFA